jgi:hypothetical protein
VIFASCQTASVRPQQTPRRSSRVGSRVLARRAASRLRRLNGLAPWVARSTTMGDFFRSALFAQTSQCVTVEDAHGSFPTRLRAQTDRTRDALEPFRSAARCLCPAAVSVRIARACVSDAPPFRLDKPNQEQSVQGRMSGSPHLEHRGDSHTLGDLAVGEPRVACRNEEVEVPGAGRADSSQRRVHR